MKIVSTLAFMALAIQFTLAAPERKLLRAGYDSPIDFSDLTSLADTSTDSTTKKQGSPAALPGIDSITKDGVLPSSDSLPIGEVSSLGKKALPTDLTTITSRSGLQSLTGGSGLNSVTDGLGKGGKLPSLPTNGVTGATDASKGVSGLTDSLGLPSTSTGGGKKQVYKSGTDTTSGVQSEDRTLKSPKLTPRPASQSSPKKKNARKTKASPKKTTAKKTSKTSPKSSHTPNVKPTQKPDPSKDPTQGPV
jgi:hypothetical protein